MTAPVYSPGEQTRMRDRMQRRVAQALRSEVGEMLADLTDGLVAQRFNPAYLIQPPTPQWVSQRWTTVAEDALAALGIPGLPTSITAMVTDATLPSEIWDAASAATQAFAAVPSERDYRDLVAAALSLDSGAQMVDAPASLVAAPALPTGEAYDRYVLGDIGQTWDATLAGIERTLASAATGYDMLRALSLLGISGKRWVAHHDHRTRETHLEADGQTVPLDASFVVGTEAMQYPADPMASIAETWNCRCTLVAADVF